MTNCGGGSGGGGLKKKQRTGSCSRLSSTYGVIDDSSSTGEGYHKPTSLRRSSSHSVLPITPVATSAGGFNDPDTADVVLRLYLDNPFPSDDSADCFSAASVEQSEVQIYLHSSVLRRSKYFSALLSDRWQHQNEDASSKIHRFNLAVPAMRDSIHDHIAVLQLLYTDELSLSINSVSRALSLLPIALELLFEDCIKACVRFLEAVPWSDDEEKRILNLVPFLSEEESKELLARYSPAKSDSAENMLHGLVLSALHNHPNMAYAKAFVAKLLRDYWSRDCVRRVLDRAFERSWNVVKQSLEEYSSPDCRGDHNETEAIQRLNLHTAMTNGKHLLWLVERMIELRVADTAVKAWSEQATFTTDLQRAFRDDVSRNIVPGVTAILLRSTSKLANAVATGNILAARQVRMKLVKDWLPLLIVCREHVSPMGPNKSLYLELEATFLRIISTLPMSDAQELLQQCLSFSTRSVEDCPHLVSAFTTWFRRADKYPQIDALSK